MGGIVRFSVRVCPRSGTTAFRDRMADGCFRISLRSAPVDGKANGELVSFLASEFGTRRTSVRIVTGSTSRRKLVAVEAPSKLPSWFSGDTGYG